MVAHSLSDLLNHCFARYGDREALVYNETRLSYRSFCDAVDRLASGFWKLGLRVGDRMALMLPNLPQFPITYYALLKIGVVVVPINVMFREQEIYRILADAEVKGFVAWEGFSSNLLQAARQYGPCHLYVFLGKSNVNFSGHEGSAKLVDLTDLIAESEPDLAQSYAQPEEPAVILYTAGVTKSERGAVLTHANLAASVLSSWEAFRIVSNHRFAAVLPLFHGLGQMLTMSLPLAAGACCILIPRFNPSEVIDIIAREGITHFVAVPAMLRELLAGLVETDQTDNSHSHEKEAPSKLKTLQALIVSGASVDDALRREIMAKLGTSVYEGYGLAECTPLVASNRPGITNKPGTVGKQLPGIEISIFDEQDFQLPPGEIGEIVVRGAGMMSGYHERDEETKNVLRDGWLHTGDMGKLDQSGYLHLIDRKDDVIMKGGFPVYSKEIERVVTSHPQVKECAVIGTADRKLGQEIKAYVVLEQPDSVSKQDLISFCERELAAYKRPRYIEFCQDLPHGSTGKILKRVLREQQQETQHSKN